jgi:hypothetical protein
MSSWAMSHVNLLKTTNVSGTISVTITGQWWWGQRVLLNPKPATTACHCSSGKWVSHNAEQTSHASMWVLSFVGLSVLRWILLLRGLHLFDKDVVLIRLICWQTHCTWVNQNPLPNLTTMWTVHANI